MTDSLNESRDRAMAAYWDDDPRITEINELAIRGAREQGIRDALLIIERHCVITGNLDVEITAARIYAEVEKLLSPNSPSDSTQVA